MSGERIFETEAERKAYLLGVQDAKSERAKVFNTVEYRAPTLEEKNRATIAWDMERYDAKFAILTREKKKEYVEYFDENMKKKNYRWAGFPEGCASWMTPNKKYTLENGAIKQIGDKNEDTKE